MRFYDGWCNMGFGVWPMIILWFIFIFAVVIGLYFIFRKRPAKSEDALEILKIKFARGEITDEEYLSKKEILLKK